MNDYGNGLAGTLGALLAWTLRPRAAPAIGAAFLGAVLTVAGSALVVSEATGYFLAGLVSSVGFALIGLWLIALNRALRSEARVPQPRDILPGRGGGDGARARFGAGHRARTR